MAAHSCLPLLVFALFYAVLPLVRGRTEVKVLLDNWLAVRAGSLTCR